MQKKKRRYKFNDLLIPILMVLCLMPFIVHLAEYDFGYEKYLWHSDNSKAQDLYAYYRSYFFLIVAYFSAIILVFRLLLYKEKTKSVKFFWLLIPYALWGVLSTIGSINVPASVSGNYYQFQSIFVLLGYLIMGFYAYQIMENEEDYKLIFKALAIVFGVMLVIGVFQIFKMDLLNFDIFQRFIMSVEQYKIYQGEIETIFTGNNVFLTLFNPNYAGVYLTMLLSVFAVVFYSEHQKKIKICYGVISLLALVLIWFTYSRATWISLLVGLLCFFGIIGAERVKRVLRYLLPALFGIAILFIVIDGLQGYKFLSRIIDTEKEERLESILTKEDGVYVSFHGQTLCLTMENGEAAVYDENETTINTTGEDGEIILPFEQQSSVFLFPINDTVYLYLRIGEYDFMFGKTESGYYYYTENGKMDQLVAIANVPIKGLHLGSGRLYIWSRTMPLLTKHLLIGSGPDTFAEVFPQNDYVGKVIYADTGARIVEKPHNDYLLHWVQTGFVSVLSLIAFYIVFIRKCYMKYKRNKLETWGDRMGCGCYIGCICYLVSCFFNDSTLYTTPVFWTFVGIALSRIAAS